jgi:hypothetical protein
MTMILQSSDEKVEVNTKPEMTHIHGCGELILLKSPQNISNLHIQCNLHQNACIICFHRTTKTILKFTRNCKNPKHPKQS